MKKYFMFFAIFGMAVIFGGCAKVPQVELDAANVALEQAVSAQADVYLEAEYLALQDSMNVINTEIEAQKSKLFGNMNDPKQKLIDVAALATELVTKTETRKEEIKTEVELALSALVTLMDENNNYVEMVPKGKEGKEAIEAIKSELAAIATSATEVQGLLESGELLAAQTKVNAASQKATDINTELKTVMEKYMKKN